MTDRTDNLTALSHQLEVAKEARAFAMTDERITMEILDGALARYAYHLDLGTQYDADTKWTEITPDEVASIFLGKTLDLVSRTEVA